MRRALINKETRAVILLTVILVSLSGIGLKAVQMNSSGQTSESGSFPFKIVEAWTTTGTGTNQTSFHTQEVVVINALIETTPGYYYYAAEQPYLVVVMITDPEGYVIFIGAQKGVATLGSTLNIAVGPVIPADAAAGTYAATIMVLSDWVSAGGSPIAEPVTIYFTVTT